jgi:hypothetical protein
LLVVKDGIISAPIVIPVSSGLGAAFTTEFVPADYGLSPGTHTLDFYGLTSDGDISSVHSVSVALVEPTLGPTEGPGSSNVGLIAGCVSGGTALLIAGGMVAYRWRKRDDNEGFIKA